MNRFKGAQLSKKRSIEVMGYSLFEKKYHIYFEIKKTNNH
jgi:hypothetical protein